MSAANDNNSPKPWDDSPAEPDLSDLLRSGLPALDDDAFDRIMTAAMNPDSELADESLVPTDEEPELTEDGQFFNPDESELFTDELGDEDEFDAGAGLDDADPVFGSGDQDGEDGLSGDDLGGVLF